MKKVLILGVLALSCAFGHMVYGAQPFLSQEATQVVENQALKNHVRLNYPIWQGGTPLSRARVNSGIEAELYQFYREVDQIPDSEWGPAKGYAGWYVGAQDTDVLSFVLVESVMMPKAAHPMHRAVGLTFDEKGNKITYHDILKVLPPKSSEDIQALITKEAQKEGIYLFSDEVAKIRTWPKNFYIGKDRGIYFIFQTYEIAPYAAGWIAIRGGTMNSDSK